MSFFDLPTVAEVDASRRGKAIGKGPSRLEIVGTRFFRLGKVRYINARAPVPFRKVV